MKKKLSIKAELEIIKRGLERNYGPIDFSKLTVESGTARIRASAFRRGDPVMSRYSPEYLERIFTPGLSLRNPPRCLPASIPLPYCPNALARVLGALFLDLTGGREQRHLQWDLTFAAMKSRPRLLPRVFRAKSALHALRVWANDLKWIARILLAKFRVRLWSLPHACVVAPPPDPILSWPDNEATDAEVQLYALSLARAKATEFLPQDASAHGSNVPTVDKPPFNEEIRS